jgi:uncharacterized repeat protein (TIGR01451 family)
MTVSAVALAAALGVFAALAGAASASVSVGCAGGVGDTAALVSAIVSADSSAGPTTISLASGCTYTFTVPYQGIPASPLAYWYGPSALPAIASSITIDGDGATIQRDPAATAQFRLFFVGANPLSPNTSNYASPGAGNLTLQNITLRGGLARGGSSSSGGGGAGMGGAIFSQGQVSLVRVTLTSNTAQGGSGNAAGTNAGGGGLGADASGTGGGFGVGFTPAGVVSAGGAGGGLGHGGGGGGGFRTAENGLSGTATSSGGGGGPPTGTGGSGGDSAAIRPGGAGGDGAGGGGFGGGSAGGGFGFGGGSFDGGGGVGGGGGGGGTDDQPGGGGFGGGGGGAGINGLTLTGGQGGFGGGGGAGQSSGGAGGFGAGAGGSTTGGGGAGLGGAIFNHQGTLTIQNSTLSGNAAVGGNGATNGQGLGGAIFDLNGQTTLDSATIAFNTASQGGALYDLGYLGADSGSPASFTYAARATVTNSILSNSTGSIGGSDAVSNAPAAVSNGATNTAAANVDASAHDLVVSQTAAGSGTFVGSPVKTDPGLGPLANNGGLTPTRALTLSSPAVDAGQTTLTTDQRGVSRPQGPADDIGAFELVQAASADLGVAINAPSTVSHRASMNYDITVSNGGPSDATNVVLTDSLPSGVDFKSDSAPAGWACTHHGKESGIKVTCTFPSMAANSAAAITLSVTVTSDGKKGPLTNTTAVASSSPPDPNTTNNTATASTNVTK